MRTLKFMIQLAFIRKSSQENYRLYIAQSKLLRKRWLFNSFTGECIQSKVVDQNELTVFEDQTYRWYFFVVELNFTSFFASKCTCTAIFSVIVDPFHY